MKLNKDYRVPEGFHPVLNYPDGETGIPVVGLAGIKLDGHGILTFCIEEKCPKLPLWEHGEIRHLGWDIPTRYAIDADRGCWIDNAHGHPLVPIEKKEFLHFIRSELRDDEATIKRLHEVLEVDSPEPGWMKKARAAGWRPPE